MRIVLVDERISEKIERSLLKAGLQPIRLPKDACLGEAVRSHPDTLLFHHEGQIITTADYCDGAAYIFSDIRGLCPRVKISFSSDERSGKYPKDCILNALVIGKRIFCKADTVSESIRQFAKRREYEIIHTNQGYPACSLLSFGNAAITADKGLGALLSENGIKVTLIREGHISLPPYEYGFIGGASGVVGKKVYFFGDISSHPDGDIICKAIMAEGYIPRSLGDGPLCDLGGIIAL